MLPMYSCVEVGVVAHNVLYTLANKNRHLAIAQRVVRLSDKKNQKL